MIWTTAKSTEVSRRQIARPSLAGRVQRPARGRGPAVTAGLAIGPAPSGRPGSVRPATPAPRARAGRPRPRRYPRSSLAPPRAPARSRRRGRRGPRARPSSGAGPAVIPAAASAASSSWRWVVDGGWLTIVKTLPSEAVRSGIVRASMNAAPAARPPGELEGEHPAAARAAGASRPRAGDGWPAPGARPGDTPGWRLEPGRERRRRRRVAVHPEGERREAAHREERRRCGARLAPVSTWKSGRRSTRLADPHDDAGHHVAVAGEVLRRGLDDEVGARARSAGRGTARRTCCRRRRSRRAGGRGRRGRRGRRRRSSGSRSSRRRGPGSARRRGPPRRRRGRSTSTNVDVDAEPAEDARRAGSASCRTTPASRRPGRRPTGASRAPRGSRPSRRRRRSPPRRPRARRRPRRRPRRSGCRGGRRRSPGTLAGRDRAELLGVGARERDGLVDRHRRRALVDDRQAVGGPDRPGREAARALAPGAASGSAMRPMLHRVGRSRRRAGCGTAIADCSRQSGRDRAGGRSGVGDPGRRLADRRRDAR